MEKVQWKVEGMTCANCALAINKYLEKQGAREVRVNAIDGHVTFEIPAPEKEDKMAKGVEGLGYRVVAETLAPAKTKRPLLKNNLERFLFCLPFTLVLMLHMIPGL